MYADLFHAIGTVETKVDEGRKLEEERWLMHNDRAEEWKEENKAAHDMIHKHLSTLPPKWLVNMVYGLYGIVGTTITAIVLIIITRFINGN